LQNKICLIHHFAGIGDIFYLQYVARKYMAMGYRIIWPLKDELLWIQDYIVDIQFCSVNDNFPGKEYYGQDLIIISPQFVYLGIMRPHLWDINSPKVMSSKYQVLNLNCENWVEGFKYNRNTEKENELYYNVLGLTDNSEYVYVNSFYNTDNYESNIFANQEYEYPVIENQIIEGYSLFDWCKVLENAKEIHTTPTSVCYLLETIDTKGKLVYTCREEYQYSEHLSLFKKKILWKLVTGETKWVN
jgi:hypothetical protein